MPRILLCQYISWIGKQKCLPKTEYGKIASGFPSFSLSVSPKRISLVLKHRGEATTHFFSVSVTLFTLERHRLSGHEFEQTPGDSEGQGSLTCHSPWGRKESDMT